MTVGTIQFLSLKTSDQNVARIFVLCHRFLYSLIYYKHTHTHTYIYIYIFRKDTKIRIFNACLKSVLLYGYETWLVTKEIQRKIQTFVNRCLRYILRIWWPNIISNKDLWKVTGQGDINVEKRKRKFRWIGHTLRKEDGEIPKAALLWNSQGNRKRGRPRNSWTRSVIKEAGRSWNELWFLAADRQKWKGLIDNLCS